MSDATTTTTTTTPAPAPCERGWGLAPEPGTRYHWSARTILADGGIDIVWDRTGMEGDYTAAERVALCAWLDVALPVLRSHAARSETFPHGSERREWLIEGDGFRLRANPNASYGYLYLSAAPCATATGRTMLIGRRRE